jgi:DNA polymerase I-like protein with 3'-5' exonuclease and polymerase domains
MVQLEDEDDDITYRIEVEDEDENIARDEALVDEADGVLPLSPQGVLPLPGAPPGQAPPPAVELTADSFLRPEDFGRNVTVDDLVRPEDMVALPPRQRRLDGDTDADDPLASMAIMGVAAERHVPLMTKPWMKHHTFHLLKTPEEVEDLIGRAIANGRCALDIESEGLDTRIYPDPVTGALRTVHQVVGFCIAYGDAKDGYYIPIRHRPEDGGPDLNIKPVDRVLAAIAKLCRAAQPEPFPEEADILSFKRHKTPPRVVIDFWHAAFDQEMLYPITGIDWWHPDSFEDGQLAFYMVYSDDKRLSLKEKAPQYLRDPEGHPYEMIKFDALFARGRAPRFETLSPDEPSIVNYACSDAICTRLLCAHPEGVPQVVASGSRHAWMYRVEKQVVQAKRVMERNRVKVDRPRAKELLAQAEEERDRIRGQIIALAESKGFPNFEPNSPAQLGTFLFDARGLDISPKPERNKASGQYKTDKVTIDELATKLGENAPPALKWIIAYRKQEKLIGTYLLAMAHNGDANDEFRFQFKQTGAATGRFSAPQGDPEQGFGGLAIHGIPGTSNLRTCFVAREGYVMVKCDYAGEELRVVTNLSGEKVWIKEFTEGEGDLHAITARAFFPGYDTEKDKEKKKGYRKAGKMANFALVYGGGAASVQRAVGCDKLEARRKKDAFDKALPTFAQWVKRKHDRVKLDKGVYTAFGRWISIPDAAIKEGEYAYHDRFTRKKPLDQETAQATRAACERHSTNYPIQGTGADIMKIAMVLIHKQCWKRGWLKNGSDSVRMLLTVHDELVFEIKPEVLLVAIEVITWTMESLGRMTTPEWGVPLVTDPLVGSNWGAETTARRAKVSKAGEREKAGPGEVHSGAFLFVKPPDWLRQTLDKWGPEWRDDLTEPYPNGEVPAAPSPAEAPGNVSVAEEGEGEDTLSMESPSDDPVPAAPPPPPAPAPAPQPAPVPAPRPPTPAPTPPAGQVLTVRLKETTRRAIPRIAGLCTEFKKEDGALLRVITASGEVLIDPILNIRVDPQPFMFALNQGNWSNGAHSLE